MPPIGQGKDERDDARPKPAAPTPARGPARDPHATPLRQGARPGDHDAHEPLRASEAADISAPHGADVPGETSGAAGMLERENEDALPRARRAEAQQD